METCIIQRQITAHVNDQETIYCLNDCGGELSLMLTDGNDSALTCDNCGALHFLNEEGLVLNG